MNKIYIDDSNETFIVKSDEPIFDNEGKKIIPFEVRKHDAITLSEVAVKIASVKLKDVIFFVNANLKFKGCKRQEQKGFELLIWLRLKGVMNHCILHSFETTHDLLKRQPKNLFATSKGTSFIQMPEVLEEFKTEEYEKETAEPENLRQSLKHFFSIDEFRHREANWWGVKSLFDIYRVISNSPNEKYPKKITEKLTEIDNSVAKYIYEFAVDKIQDEIEKEEELIKSVIAELRNEIFAIKEKSSSANAEVQSVEDELQKLKTTIQGLEESYKISNQAEILKYRNELQNQIEEWIELIQPQKKSVELHDNLKLKREEEINSLTSELTNVFSKVKSKYETELVDFNSTKQIIDNRTIEILYIDDNAGNGWTDAFRKMLPKAKLRSVIPKKQYQENIDELYFSQIKNEIKKETSLILLDLRLFDEEERSIATESLSGEKLLKKIREDFSAIPILIITASNKIWSHQRLMNLGADAYWIKEGLDEVRTANESLKNYTKFFLMIEKLTGVKFQLLKEFGAAIEQFKEENNLWWKGIVEWSKIGSKHNMNLFGVPTSTIPDENIILSILNDSFILLREHIQRTELQNIYNPFQENEWVLPSIIIQHLGKIVEVIHDFNGYEMQPNRFRKCLNKGLIEDFRLEAHEVKRYDSSIINVEAKTHNVNPYLPIRNDRNGGKIFDKRNEASHTNNLSLINFNELCVFIQMVCEYLKTEPRKISNFTMLSVS